MSAVVGGWELGTRQAAVGSSPGTVPASRGMDACKQGKEPERPLVARGMWLSCYFRGVWLLVVGRRRLGGSDFVGWGLRAPAPCPAPPCGACAAQRARAPHARMHAWHSVRSTAQHSTAAGGTYGSRRYVLLHVGRQHEVQHHLAHRLLHLPRIVALLMKALAVTQCTSLRRGRRKFSHVAQSWLAT